MTATTLTPHRIAIGIYEDAARDLARPYRGLLTALEFLEAGDDVIVVYDGSGVDTLAAAADPGHQLHRLVEKLHDVTLGACGFCAKAHGVSDTLADAGWTLLGDYKGHASVRDLVADGRTLLSF